MTSDGSALDQVPVAAEPTIFVDWV
jgi:hypothetical protein